MVKMAESMIEVAEEIKNIMKNKKLRLAVAESLTAGKLQALIASVSGSSEFFEGGRI